jgi:hypothetical protein
VARGAQPVVAKAPKAGALFCWWRFNRILLNSHQTKHIWLIRARINHLSGCGLFYKIIGRLIPRGDEWREGRRNIFTFKNDIFISF